MLPVRVAVAIVCAFEPNEMVFLPSLAERFPVMVLVSAVIVMVFPKLWCLLLSS